MPMAAPEPAARAATLRLLTPRGRVAMRRPAILLAAARARGGASVYTLWPDARTPMICADVAYPPAAAWLRRTIVPTLRRLPDAAGWMALRAGAAVLGERPGLAARAATRNLAVGRPRVAMYRYSGQVASKAVLFVFADGDEEPRAVVKAMGERRFGWRLRRETDLLEAIRGLVAHAPAVAAALPPPALDATELDGEVIVVEALDPLALAAGEAEREPALRWLRAFRLASASGTRPWDPADTRDAVAAVREAWTLAGGAAARRVTERVVDLLAPLTGAPLLRCAVHGDFWAGNVATVGDRVRVVDWGGPPWTARRSSISGRTSSGRCARGWRAGSATSGPPCVTASCASAPSSTRLGWTHAGRVRRCAGPRRAFVPRPPAHRGGGPDGGALRGPHAGGEAPPHGVADRPPFGADRPPLAARGARVIRALE